MQLDLVGFLRRHQAVRRARLGRPRQWASPKDQRQGGERQQGFRHVFLQAQQTTPDGRFSCNGRQAS